jgi:hypothetical protein
LQVKDFLGLDFGVFAQLPEKQINMVLGVAERALIARGFLIPDTGNKFKLTDVVHAVLRTCSNPDKTLSINCKYPEKPEETYFFHTARKMCVFHSVPITAIHQFLALENQSELAKSAFAILNLANPPRLNCPGGQISEEALNEVREMVEKSDKADLASTLVKNGLDSDTSQEFAKSLKTLKLNHTVVHIDHQKNSDEQVEGFALLQGENGLWMLIPEKTDSKSTGMVSVKPTTTAEVGQKLKQVMLS